MGCVPPGGADPAHPDDHRDGLGGGRVVVLLAWIPLRNKPGIGTVANVIVIAVTVDAGLAVLTAPESVPARVALMSGAVLLNAVSTVIYVGAGLGPGPPRDGLMTGLVARTGVSVRVVRTVIEATVLAVGWLLGGSVGVGTVVYAFGIGPIVQLVLRLTPETGPGCQRVGEHPREESKKTQRPPGVRTPVNTARWCSVRCRRRGRPPTC